MKPSCGFLACCLAAFSLTVDSSSGNIPFCKLRASRFGVGTAAPLLLVTISRLVKECNLLHWEQARLALDVSLTNSRGRC